MGTPTRTFTFWRREEDLHKPITCDCELVDIPFRSNLGPEIITKVMNTDKYEIVGIEEDGTWTMSIIARKIDKPIYNKKK